PGWFAGSDGRHHSRDAYGDHRPDRARAASYREGRLMSRFRHYLAFRFETLVFFLFVIWMVVYPLYASFFGVLNYAYFLSFTFLSISLGLIWGYAGILSFGQTVFFGIGGYLYGVYTLNFTGGIQTWIGAVIAVAAGAF